MIYGNKQLMKTPPVLDGPITLLSYTNALAVPYPTVCTIAYPTGIIANDLLILFIADSNSTSLDSWTAADITGGWTKLTGYANSAIDAGIALFYKYAVGGESGNVTITPTTSLSMTANIIHIRYANTTNWLGSISAYNASGSAASLAANALTGVGTDYGLAFASFDGGDGFSLSAGGTGDGGTWTLLDSFRSGTSSISDVSSGMAKLNYNGNTGGSPCTFSAGAVDGFVVIQLRIKK